MCLLCRTSLIRYELVAAEALLTMTMSDQGCASDFAGVTSVWSVGRRGGKPGEAALLSGAWGQRVQAPLPSTGHSPHRSLRNTQVVCAGSLLLQHPVLIAHLRSFFLLSDTWEPEEILLSASLRSSPAFN